MQAMHDTSEIRAATCTITDRAAFLAGLRKIASDHETRIICFNADLIAGRSHAAFAVMLAQRAFGSGENISNTLEMEALLFAAGSRQCSLAAPYGIHNGENRLWVCCLPGSTEAWVSLGSLFRFVSGDWDTITTEKRELLMKNYRISADEIAAAGGKERLVDLVLERVALLQILR